MNKLREFTLLLISMLLYSSSSFAQARLVLNNNPYMVMNGGTSGTPAYLIVDNPAANAITLATAQSGGGIISEAEFNQVKWNIGTATGIYTIPFTRAFGGTILPLTVNVTAAGTGTGNIKFSTFTGGGWDNDAYRPSDVTNMGAPNNSAYAVDRFWIADANGYTAKPTPIFTFQYADDEWSAAGNTILESNLFAQRFNAPGNNWGDWMGPFGTVNTVANTVSSGSVSPADFFRSWTLADQAAPLSVELFSFTAECKEDNVIIRWVTVSETNNDYFTIERAIPLHTGQAGSDSGKGGGMLNWKIARTVKGVGNSIATRNYEFIDSELPLLTADATFYYRLKQTDFDGSTKTHAVISSRSCNSDGTMINAYPYEDGLAVNFRSLSGGNYSISIFNVIGVLVRQENKFFVQGLNTIKIPMKAAPGIYFIAVQSNAEFFTAKTLLR